MPSVQLLAKYRLDLGEEAAGFVIIDTLTAARKLWSAHRKGQT